MLRLTRLAAIAFALVFPLTLLTAQQSGAKGNSKKPDLFKDKHFVQLAHKPELAAKSHQLSDDEKRDAIQSALSRITMKKATRRISADSTLVLTPNHAIDTNDFYLTAMNANLYPVQNTLTFPPNKSSLHFFVTVKPNTLYTLVIDVNPIIETFIVQGGTSVLDEASNLSTQTTPANVADISELLYSFDAASAGQIDVSVSATNGDANWEFKKAELIATPLD